MRKNEQIMLTVRTVPHFVHNVRDPDKREHFPNIQSELSNEQRHSTFGNLTRSVSNPSCHHHDLADYLSIVVVP